MDEPWGSPEARPACRALTGRAGAQPGAARGTGPALAPVRGRKQQGEEELRVSAAALGFSFAPKFWRCWASAAARVTGKVLWVCGV